MQKTQPKVWTPGTGYEPLGTLAEGGEIGDVPYDINNSGQIEGSSDIPDLPWQVAFLYTDDTGMVSLGSLEPVRPATAAAINDAGQIAGHSAGQAFFYSQETAMIPLGAGAGFAINNNGVVAGVTEDYEAAIFDKGTVWRIGRLGGTTWANGINDHNVAVGTTLPERSGFIWSEAEGIQRLDALMEPAWSFYKAWAINNNGQIAGEANGKAVRLDPIPPAISIGRSATNAVVSWSPAWPGIVLEAASDLSAPNWEPVETGGTNAVNLPIAGPSRFFRLNLEGIRGLCCVPEE